MKTTNNKRGLNNFMFASIVNGAFAVKVDKDTEGAVTRKNKNGVEVHELIFNEVDEVYVHDIEIRDTDFGKQMSIYLRDTEETEKGKHKFFVIQAQLNSGYAVSFLNRVQNVDLKKPVKVSIFEIENKDENDETKIIKTKTIVIYQDGKSLDKIWTKDNNPVPKAEPVLDKKKVQVVKNGYPVFDSTEKEKFLQDFTENTVVPRLKDELKDLYTKEKPQVMDVVDVEAEKGDDLPF